MKLRHRLTGGYLLVCLASVFLASVAAYPQEKKELADLNLYSDSLSAEGVWRPDNLNDKTEIAFDSVTRLECYKHGGKDLVDSDAYCMQATAANMLGMPDIKVAYYPVVIWDKDKVIAADSSTDAYPVCIWTQITINLHDHSIMATDTRKLSRATKGLTTPVRKSRSHRPII